MLATRGGRLDRQMTLRGALDWSWDLLLPTEKSALAQLSVFEGGFTLEAVEGPCSRPSKRVNDIVHGPVPSLLDKSFVRQILDGSIRSAAERSGVRGQHLRSRGPLRRQRPLCVAIDAEVRHGDLLQRLSEEEVTAPGLDGPRQPHRRACRRASRAGGQPPARRDGRARVGDARASRPVQARPRPCGFVL